MLESKPKFQSRAAVKTSGLAVCVLLVLVWGTSGNAQTQTDKSKVVKAHSDVQQPLYREYRGVRLGMTAEETRAKLGTSVLKSDDQDYYVFSENETAQIAYNADHKVVTISTDYIGGVGAPDYRTVVGSDLQVRADGSTYKSVIYEGEALFVSYNRSAGVVPMVTITIQRMK